MSTSSKVLTSNAFISSRDIHRRNNVLFICVFFSCERRTNYQSFTEFARIASCSSLVSNLEVSFSHLTLFQ